MYALSAGSRGGQRADFVGCCSRTEKLGIGVTLGVSHMDVNGVPNKDFKLVDSWLLPSKANGFDGLGVLGVGGVERRFVRLERVSCVSVELVNLCIGLL